MYTYTTSYNLVLLLYVLQTVLSKVQSYEWKEVEFQLDNRRTDGQKTLGLVELRLRS